MQKPRVFYADPNGADTKDPSVCRFNGKYFLYYSQSHPDGWAIGIATSGNLLDWTYAGNLTRQGAVEGNGICAPGVVVLNGQVHLFYQSYGTGPRDAIQHAVSTDGIHFVRDATNPIFSPKGDWTNGRAIDAEAAVVGNRLLLYFATRDPAGKLQMVGIAAAPLGSDFSRTAWTQLTVDQNQVFRPTIPTELDDPHLDLAWEHDCIEAPTLITHHGMHYLFYAGAYNNHPQQIGVAVSDDGVRFRRLNRGQPFLAPGAAESWNASESGHPGVFTDNDGVVYLFYQGDNVKTGIKWHISMVPIAWRPGENGGPEVPVLDSARLVSMHKQ